MDYLAWKRCCDVLGAAIICVALLPLFVLLIVAALLFQGWPVIFTQRRVGLGGTSFSMIKFRTMRDGTPNRLADRPVAKHPDDPRITPFGRLLRRTSLDELPQLINVLRGEMSLVGPRPLPEEDLAQPEWIAQVGEAERARRLDWVTRRHHVLPGLTGLWQITSNPTHDFGNWIDCDLRYVESVNFRTDLRVLLRTPAAVLRGREK